MYIYMCVSNFKLKLNHMVLNRINKSRSDMRYGHTLLFAIYYDVSFCKGYEYGVFKSRSASATPSARAPRHARATRPTPRPPKRSPHSAWAPPNTCPAQFVKSIRV